MQEKKVYQIIEQISNYQFSNKFTYLNEIEQYLIELRNCLLSFNLKSKNANIFLNQHLYEVIISNTNISRFHYKKNTTEIENDIDRIKDGAYYTVRVFRNLCRYYKEEIFSFGGHCWCA